MTWVFARTLFSIIHTHKQRHTTHTKANTLTDQYKYILKLVSAFFYQVFVFPPNDSPSKTMKSVFYFVFYFFISVFVLEIFKLL